MGLRMPADWNLARGDRAAMTLLAVLFPPCYPTDDCRRGRLTTVGGPEREREAFASAERTKHITE